MYRRILVRLNSRRTTNNELDGAIKLATPIGVRVRVRVPELQVADKLPFSQRNLRSGPARPAPRRRSSRATQPHSPQNGDDCAAMPYGAVTMQKNADEAALEHARLTARTTGVAAETTHFDSPGNRLCNRVVQPPRPLAGSSGGLLVEPLVRPPVRPLCDRSMQQLLQRGAKVIVLGNHGRRFVGGALFGNAAEQIVRNATGPVLRDRGTPPDGDHTTSTAVTPTRSEPT